jgi:hypothetical protein
MWRKRFAPHIWTILVKTNPHLAVFRLYGFPLPVDKRGKPARRLIHTFSIAATYWATQKTPPRYGGIVFKHFSNN